MQLLLVQGQFTTLFQVTSFRLNPGPIDNRDLKNDCQNARETKSAFNVTGFCHVPNLTRPSKCFICSIHVSLCNSSSSLHHVCTASSDLLAFCLNSFRHARTIQSRFSVQAAVETGILPTR